ncbi:MAG: pilus assembly protein TadG-related protein [Parvularculaceae bacterium]
MKLAFRLDGRGGENGNVALAFGLLLPVLLAAGGAAVDAALFAAARQQLQEISDAAALAGGREFLLNKSHSNFARERAATAFSKLVAVDPKLAGAKASIAVEARERSVRVNASYGYQPTLLVALFKSPIMIDVSSTAQVSGGANICVIALHRDGGGAVKLDDKSLLRGSDCAVFSNSVDPHGLVVNGGAQLRSAFTCSSGGFAGPATGFDPPPLTDCPRREDPLSSFVEPAVGACTHADLTLLDFSGRLSPGVYCGGLVIDGQSLVTFDPGIYVIKDGEFQVKDRARISGEGAGFFFVGEGSRLMFEDRVSVSLSAPENGPMAGILFWRSRHATGPGVFEVKSNFVDRLVGTIYLPNDVFYVSVTDEVAEASAYTAIIAEQIWLVGRSRLILNADYELSPVPPPSGLANAGEQVRLRG